MAKAIVFAPISAAVAAKAVKALVSAASKAEGSQVTLLTSTASAVALIGRGMTSKEWDNLVTPGLKAGLEACPTVADGTIGGYLSRMKKCALGMLSKAYAPLPAETLGGMYARIGDGLQGVKLANGELIYAAGKKGGSGTPGRKAGAPAANKKAPPSAPRDLSGSAGKVADAEGGNNAAPDVRAAEILMGGPGDPARNLAIMAKSYRADLEAFCRAHLAKVAQDALKRASTNRDARKGTPPRIVPPAVKPNGAAVN